MRLLKLKSPPAASPHSSTPNISAVHHADSRGSLVSTDSGNSLLDKSSDKTNSLEKVDECSNGLIAFILLNINFCCCRNPNTSAVSPCSISEKQLWRTLLNWQSRKLLELEEVKNKRYIYVLLCDAGPGEISEKHII